MFQYNWCIAHVMISTQLSQSVGLHCICWPEKLVILRFCGFSKSVKGMLILTCFVVNSQQFNFSLLPCSCVSDNSTFSSCHMHNVIHEAPKYYAFSWPHYFYIWDDGTCRKYSLQCQKRLMCHLPCEAASLKLNDGIL